MINNSNKLSASLYRLHGELVQKYSFGIAGAAVWKVCGPYFEALEKQDHPDHPSPHGEGCVLPSLECMVNNAVYLEKPYLNEQAWLAGALTGEVFECINAYEDRICFDFYRLEGQCCFYLEQEIYSPDDREVWLVVGNNDGFKLWLNETVIIERDEMRYWTPYNNAEMVKLKEGVNRLSIKLLRRSINLEFAIGFRYCEGEHWHKKEWITDMGVVVHE